MPPATNNLSNPQEWGRDVQVDRWHPAAAGAGTRFTANEHKLHADRRGSGPATLSPQLLAAHIGPTIVVTGATPLKLDPYEVHEAHNPDWAHGQATSLLAGITFAQTIKPRRRSSDLLITRISLKHGNESQVQMPSSPPPHMAVSQVTP